ncbi:MAG: winged helix DNA-binding domain-containing protein [Bacteroidetes bacterium]|nr:winged helix DNA-binding domain-containing protein [Bacteroidota bacterium]
MDIIRARIHHQHLGKEKRTSPANAVAWFGAVQAQDYHAALWGVSLRLSGVTLASLEAEFNNGSFLRTHVLRPTWHFVAPDNVRWMQQATAHRVRLLMAGYDRSFGIDRKFIRRTNTLLEKELRDATYLTREELADRLKRNRVTAEGQKLAHIMMHAELDALICSGPRRGNQFTYALLDERAPVQRPLEKEEALAELAAIYVRSHGPVLLKDFAWWSGLTLKEAGIGLNAAAPGLRHETIGGQEYWSAAGVRSAVPPPPSALLLSVYDEFHIAYKDRSALGGAEYDTTLKSMGNDLTSLLLIDGRIAGTWKRTLGTRKAEITVSRLRRLTANEKKVVRAEGERYGAFAERPCTVTFL